MIKNIQIRIQVIVALILRDVKTRFGRTYFGYFIAVIWPLTHMLGITIIFSFLHRSSPVFGADNTTFIVTGVLPYILFIYPARMISFVFDTNKSLFIFPIINSLDLILSRAIVECLTAIILVIIFFIIANSAGFELIPFLSYTALASLSATIYLSVCLGILSAVIISVFRFWHTAFAVICIIAYLTSGIFVPIENTSESFQKVVWFNPLAHCVEWLRSAYYLDYGQSFISVTYVLWFSNCAVMVALTGERFIRGRLLEQ